jgi:hypothetical protein
MSKVAQLSPAQYEALNGQIFDDYGSVYNPVLDATGAYCITEAEIAATTQPAFLWVKDLPLIDYITPTPPPFPYG